MERYKKRKGVHKTRSNLEDVISMMHDLGTNVPIFVAKDIHKLPPVSFDSIDVSCFLHKIEKLDANFTGIKLALEEYTAKKNSELDVLAAAFYPKANEQKKAHPEQPRMPKENNGTRVAGDMVKPSDSVSKLANTKKPMENDARIQNLKRVTGEISGIPMQADMEGQLLSNHDEDGGATWSQVVRKGRKQPATTRQATIGRGTNKGEHAQKVKPVLREISLFSSKWPIYVEVPDVIAYFKDAHNMVAKVIPITTRAESYKCFKITLCMADPSKAYEPEFWPERVAFRRYFYRAGDRTLQDKVNRSNLGERENSLSGQSGVINPRIDKNGQECNRDGRVRGSNTEINIDAYESCTDDEGILPVNELTIVNNE